MLVSKYRLNFQLQGPITVPFSNQGPNFEQKARIPEVYGKPQLCQFCELLFKLNGPLNCCRTYLLHFLNPQLSCIHNITVSLFYHVQIAGKRAWVRADLIKLDNDVINDVIPSEIPQNGPIVSSCLENCFIFVIFLFENHVIYISLFVYVYIYITFRSSNMIQFQMLIRSEVVFVN